MFGTVRADRPHQGDIFQKLQYKFIAEDGDTETITFPFWVIMAQECDLEHDYKATKGDYSNQDKCLQTIAACPAFPKEQLKAGLHMQNLSLKVTQWGGKDWEKILGNSHPRFHTIEATEIKELQDLVVDFKKVFSFPRYYVYASLDHKVATLDVLYREGIAQRFAYFSSRIALPDELQSQSV